VKAYGTSGLQPHREDDPLQGRFPYDVSKACMDLIASMYAHSFGVPAAIVRCGNLYGGGDLNFSRLIPGLIRATLNDERFSIRSDGKCVRDFLYVEDAAEAYLWLAEAMALDHSLHGEAFNFGLELRCTMIEVTERILSLMGRSDLIPIVQNMAIGETREQILDVTKARVRLKWSPRYGMDEGLKLTIDWYSKFLRLANHRPVVLGNASRESEVPKSQTEASAYL
jgi:CDP-glucose 4,6-dehydratase